MEENSMFEKNKIYSIYEIEDKGLKEYKNFTSGNVVFVKDSFSYWFDIQRDFFQNLVMYRYIMSYENK
jgi:hypothetical protein